MIRQPGPRIRRPGLGVREGDCQPHHKSVAFFQLIDGRWLPLLNKNGVRWTVSADTGRVLYTISTWRPQDGGQSRFVLHPARSGSSSWLEHHMAHALSSVYYLAVISTRTCHYSFGVRGPFKIYSLRYVLSRLYSKSQSLREVPENPIPCQQTVASLCRSLLTIAAIN